MAELFDERRRLLHQQLTELNPRLGGIYRRAIRLIAEPAEAGEELARFSLIGHSMRELINRFPDALNDVRGAVERPPRDANALLNDLAKVADRSLPSVTDSTGDGPTELNVVEINRDTADLLLRIRAAHLQGTLRAQERDAVAVSAARTRGGPAYERWRAARAFFYNFTHLDNFIGGDERTLPTDAEVLHHLQMVEGVARVRMTGFFAIRDEIDKLLDETNRGPATPANSAPPATDTVLAVITTLTTLQYRRVFYGRLDNPNWVKPLAEHGAFAPPPIPKQSGDGAPRFDPWPEIDYLERVAERAPNDILPVAVALLEKQNHPWIRQGLVRIAILLPVKDSITFAPFIIGWLRGEPAWRSNYRDLAALAARWLSGGAHNKGEQLANQLLRPRPETSGSRRVVTGVEEYWYSDALAIVGPGYGDKYLSKLCLWLTEYETASKSALDSRDSDSSYLWRSRIASADGMQSDVGDALVDAVRDEAIKIAQVAPNEIKLRLLGPKATTLPRRIAYFALATALAERPASQEALVDLGLSFVSSADLRDAGMFSEFSLLLRAIAAVRGPDALAPLAHVLDQGPLGSRKDLLDRAKSYEPDADAELVADRFERHWRHRVLTGIGQASLPTPLAKELADFDESDGVIDEPFPPSVRVANWGGVSSPASVEELKKLDAARLLDFVGSWEPNSDSWHDGPSRDGLATELRTLVSQVPDRFSGHDEALTRLRPIYRRALFDGWKEALNAGRALPAKSVLTVVGHLAGESAWHGDAGAQESYAEDLPDLQWTKQSALHLVVDWLENVLFDKVTIGDREILAGHVLRFLSDEGLREQYSTGGTEGDPLTIGLNHAVPLSLHAAVLLVSYELGPARSVVLDALSNELLQPDPRGAMASVLGRDLAWLFNHAREWLDEHASELYGGAESLLRSQQVALTTSLATVAPHSALLEVLRPALLLVMRTRQEIAPGWRTARSPDLLIGDWIIDAYVRNQTPLRDELLEAFFTRFSPEVRGDVLGHLGWSLMRAPSVDQVCLDNAATLWDARAQAVDEDNAISAELGEFFWWVRSNRWNAEWWIPRFEHALTRYPRSTSRGMIGEQLAAASHAHPGRILSIIEKLTRPESDDEYATAYLTLEPVVVEVIARALDSGNTQVAAAGSKYMDSLGARGFLDLKRLVEEFRLR
jgi:hypothetical protein